jgi:lipopolysaccharide export system protein LptC
LLIKGVKEGIGKHRKASKVPTQTSDILGILVVSTVCWNSQQNADTKEACHMNKDSTPNYLLYTPLH